MPDTKVFVNNKSGHDYSDAERFGELIFITEGTIDRLDTNYMYRKIEETLKDSRPEDRILLAGLSHQNSLTCAYFAAKHKCLNILIFVDGKYVERRHTF